MSNAPSYRQIIRRKSRQIMVGAVPVGGNAPITVQTMINVPTTDVRGAIAQVAAAAGAGADIVRVSCPDRNSVRAFKEIAHASPTPLVADIHFHYLRGVEAAAAGAACLRINPGNIGSDQRVREVVKAARDNGCSIRIGINAGSLERDLLEKYGEPCPEAMVESARRHMDLLEDNDFFDFKISVKASDVFLTVAAYTELARVCDYPLHLGITEAGGLRGGTVQSAIGLGMLLRSGIGDTIRVSLSADPVEEVRVGYDILKALRLRHRGVRIVSCPSCARQGFDVIKVVAELERRTEHVTAPITVSIIGCVVNGPGEARSADIGITGGGDGLHMVYMAGRQDHRIDSDRMIDHLVERIEAEATAMEAKTRLTA